MERLYEAKEPRSGILRKAFTLDGPGKSSPMRLRTL